MRHHDTAGYGTRRRVLSVDEAAEALGIARSTVYRLIASGDLSPVRVGQRLKFRPEDLDAYLERNREPAP